MSEDVKVTARTYVPTDDWQEGEIVGTGPRWRLLEEKTLTKHVNGIYGLDSDEQALLDHAAEQFGRRLDDSN